MDHAPVHELRNAEDGKLLQILQANSVTALQSKGWKKPQRFSAKGRDGVTDIYGLIVWPHDFEAGKKYPVSDTGESVAATLQAAL